jgi:DNA modification methylase
VSEKIVQGDCLEVMRDLPDACVDAIVTDPPYGLVQNKRGGSGVASIDLDSLYGRSRIGTGNGPGGFMGKEWDSCVPGVPFWAEALRVAKPGAYIVAFGGTRTYHRLACAIEDAGWEIRDCFSWLYGSGFPKSLDVSKTIAKRAGGEIQARAAIEWMQQERERLGLSRAELEIRIFGRSDGNVRNWEDGISLPRPGLWSKIRVALGHDATPFDAAMERGDEKIGEADGSYGYQADGSRWERLRELREPATDAARQWQGWGTALKPAWEPIILARKPLVGTVAANMIKHGTGAINVDGCRIGGGVERKIDNYPSKGPQGSISHGVDKGHAGDEYTTKTVTHGRWPANVVLGCACDGDTHDENCAAAMLDAQTGTLTSGNVKPGYMRNSTAQPSRGGYEGGFKDAPLTGFGDSGGASRFFYTAKASRRERGAGNTHPTVKPVALMRWLCRLVCPPGGSILDPFAGSGTTLLAAHLEGFDYLGIEREAEYVEIAQQRLANVETLRESTDPQRRRKEKDESESEGEA